jgi:bifunctional non-homologous end joining protein LigD
LGRMIHKIVPGITTINISSSSRGNKLFIDPSQNDYSDTLAVAYSVRPYPVPTVSAPLDWKEVKTGLDPAIFTMDSMLKRVRAKGDLFRGALDSRVAEKNSFALQKL